MTKVYILKQCYYNGSEFFENNRGVVATEQEAITWQTAVADTETDYRLYELRFLGEIENDC